MDPQLRRAILDSGQNITLNINADDLRELVHEMMQEERRRIDVAVKVSREQPTLTRRQTCDLLDVSVATLERWERDGYLTPVRIGRKIMYRPCDIDEILLRRG